MPTQYKNDITDDIEYHVSLLLDTFIDCQNIKPATQFSRHFEKARMTISNNILYQKKN